MKDTITRGQLVEVAELAVAYATGEKTTRYSSGLERLDRSKDAEAIKTFVQQAREVPSILRAGWVQDPGEEQECGCLVGWIALDAYRGTDRPFGAVISETIYGNRALSTLGILFNVALQSLYPGRSLIAQVVD